MTACAADLPEEPSISGRYYSSWLITRNDCGFPDMEVDSAALGELEIVEQVGASNSPRLTATLSGTMGTQATAIISVPVFTGAYPEDGERLHLLADGQYEVSDCAYQIAGTLDARTGVLTTGSNSCGEDIQTRILEGTITFAAHGEGTACPTTECVGEAPFIGRYSASPPCPPE